MDRLDQLVAKWRIQAETLLAMADDIEYGIVTESIHTGEDLNLDPDDTPDFVKTVMDVLDTDTETHSLVSPTEGPATEPEDEWPREEPPTHEPDRPNRGTFKIVGGTLMFYADDVDALAQALEDSDYTVAGIQGIDHDVNVSAALKKLERTRSSMEALEALVPGNYEMFNVAIGNLNRARQLLGDTSGE